VKECGVVEEAFKELLLRILKEGAGGFRGVRKVGRLVKLTWWQMW
jgi:hypothetical protein